MKTNHTHKYLAATLLLSTLSYQLSTPPAHAQGTAFTYQGRLNDGAALANGYYDLRFALYDTLALGSQWGNLLTNAATAVSNGLFTVTLDFGSQFPGAARWLEIGVRTNGNGSFSTLSPRQALTPAPYAIFSGSAGSVASASVSPAQFNTPIAPGNGQVLAYNGSSLVWTNPPSGGGSSNAWSLAGNAGTTPTTNYIGTSDYQTLEFRVNGVRALSVVPSDGEANLAVGSYLGSPAFNSDELSWNPQGIIKLGRNSSVASSYSTVGGGTNNQIATFSDYSTISGGYGNFIHFHTTSATIGGGIINKIEESCDYSTIAGGNDNIIGIPQDQYHSWPQCTIGGGNFNHVRWGRGATIAGGEDNYAGYDVTQTGNDSSVGGGFGNAAQGDYSTVPGGLYNWAAGKFSYAAGNRAKAINDGTFVWADSQNADFNSTANNQFCIRAQGGVVLDNSTPAITFGNQTRQMLNLWNANYGIGVQNNTEYFRTAHGFAWFLNGAHSDTENDPGGGSILMLLNNVGLSVNGTFVSSSDRNVKTGFAPVDTKTILAKVAAMPITRWQYTNDLASAHIGPMAQDFYAAFNVGPDDKHITTVDESGVALAAIQGLNEKVDEKVARIQEQESRIQNQGIEIQQLQQSVAELKALLRQLSAPNHQASANP